MTFEEFFEWCDEDTRAEWVNGKVELMTPVNVTHQRIAMFLSIVLGTYIERRGLGELIAGPAGFKNSTRPSFREPDLFFVAHANRARVKHPYVDGPPDLTVEIVSPSDRRRDTKIKFEEYALGGVHEYWLIDPDRERASFYTIGPAGRYVEQPPDAEGVYRSTVVTGFFLRVEWLWRRPETHAVLQELGVR